MVDRTRTRTLNDKQVQAGPVVYWMQRDQRVHDNWALLFAQEVALLRKVPLLVLFRLSKSKLRLSKRHYDFMLSGLREVESELNKYNIPFILLETGEGREVLDFAKKYKVGQLVTDFSPLRNSRKLRAEVAEGVECAFTEVDAHNIVPCFVASEKEEFAAYTIRPKIHRKLPTYLTDFPRLRKHPHKHTTAFKKIDWAEVEQGQELDTGVSPVSWITPGEKAAQKQLRTFIENKLSRYGGTRNDPTVDGQSNLSPYLHFGQISAQRIAYEVNSKYEHNKDACAAFLEELIVRRELADNYCFYNKNYDKVAGTHAWAQKTIAEHKHEEREYLYTKEQFENAKTHDDLWNAMQLQMVHEGKMHGWCRMYWAKKILEWTPDAQTAIDIALYLNDTYELDGHDPNGVAGVMWSICGVHDRAWNERPIFGKIRYMNYAGAKRKFDIKAYIEKYGRKESLFE